MYLESLLSSCFPGGRGAAGGTMPATPVNVAPTQRAAGVAASQGLPGTVREDLVMSLWHSEVMMHLKGHRKHF